MVVLHGISGLKQLPGGVVLSVGNFDGVHRGHRRILELANELRSEAGISVVTFEPHPLTVIRPQLAPPRLTLLAMKQALLEPLGVDHLVVLPPTPEVLNLTAEDFWRILRDDVRPSHMIEGESFSFGKGRSGSIERLREWATASDVKLHVIDPVRIPLLDLQVRAGQQFADPLAPHPWPRPRGGHLPRAPIHPRRSRRSGLPTRPNHRRSNR